eukprot:gene15039-21110_t
MLEPPGPTDPHLVTTINPNAAITTDDPMLEQAVPSDPQSKSAMVFFDRKASAIAVNALVRSVRALHTTMKSCAFLGQYNRAGGGSGKLSTVYWSMGRKEQLEAMQRFRQGHYKVLVSTYVGSEGLDFKQCSLVVSADPPKNVAAMVQCRGRARREGAGYVLLYEKGCQSHKRLLITLHKYEATIQSRLKARSSLFSLARDGGGTQAGGGATLTETNHEMVQQGWLSALGGTKQEREEQGLGSTGRMFSLVGTKNESGNNSGLTSQAIVTDSCLGLTTQADVTSSGLGLTPQTNVEPSGPGLSPLANGANDSPGITLPADLDSSDSAGGNGVQAVNSLCGAGPVVGSLAVDSLASDSLAAADGRSSGGLENGGSGGGLGLGLDEEWEEGMDTGSGSPSTPLSDTDEGNKQQHVPLTAAQMFESLAAALNADDDSTIDGPSVLPLEGPPSGANAAVHAPSLLASHTLEVASSGGEGGLALTGGGLAQTTGKRKPLMGPLSICGISNSLFNSDLLAAYESVPASATLVGADSSMHPLALAAPHPGKPWGGVGRARKSRKGNRTVVCTPPGFVRPCYVVRSTGARVPLACSQMLIEQFCMQLPGNDG